MQPATVTDTVRKVTSIRGTVFAGTSALALFLGGFSAWAFVLPLSGAIIAPGIVVTDGSIQVVRHERGGVLVALTVREGAAVKKGDILATLSRAEDRAAEDELKARISGLSIKQARLTAEQSGASDLVLAIADLPDEVRGGHAARLGELIEDQQQEFASRRSQLDSGEAVLKAQRRGLEEQLIGLDGEITSLEDQLKSLEKDVTLRRQAVANGLSRESTLRETERQADSLRGGLAKATASVKALQEQISETEKRIEAQKTEFLQKVGDELSRVRAEKIEAMASLVGKSDAVSRVDVRAPVDGVINKVNVNTVGSAVEPFAPMFEIVADNQPLLIEARVAPSDIDDVYPRQTAHIVLSAFNRRVVDPVPAMVEFVGADARKDEAKDEAYYTIRLSVSKAERAKLPQILPGMPAETYLVTHERTFADYIAEPFIQSFQRAFRQ